MSVEVAGPLTHRCVGCGTSCHGVQVRVLEDERESLSARAEQLGVDAPFDGDHLRLGDRGACVFLDANQRCRLHAEFGAEAKPWLCRQYPLVAVEIEGEVVRAGVDPGCAHAWQSWPEGPEVPDEEVYLSSSTLGTYDGTVELAMIGLCDPAQRSLGDVLGALRGLNKVEGLPIGIASRLARRALDSRIAERLVHPDTAAPIRAHLEPVAALLDTLDPDRLPVWRLGEREERWAIEATRRFLFLRLNAGAPVMARTLGMLTGAVLVGWASPEPDRFGPALACWSRVMRTDALTALFGTDEHIQALVRR